MDTPLRSQVVFHLTGRRAGARTRADALPEGLRPALLAPYRRLETLRHDFPLVLCKGRGEYVESLSAAVDAALRAVAPPGLAGEAMRRRALQVERDIRRRVTGGASGSLGELWALAVAESGPSPSAEAFGRDVAKVYEALPVDGEVVGCDDALPPRFARHAWEVVQREKAQAAQARIDRLVTRLDDILRADEARSPGALAPRRLQASFGDVHRNLFDFAAMSRLLRHAGPHGGLAPSRRERIGRVLGELRMQRFYPDGADTPSQADFVFGSAGEALDAFLARLPDMVQLHKAMQVAELEVEGQYVEPLHDPIFAAIDEASLTATDLQFFPDFLVCTNSTSGSNAALLEALSAGVPLKVMVQVGDLLEQSGTGRRRFAFGMREAQLASAAMSLEGVFALQTVASNLPQMRDAVQRGLRHPGPSLFAVYAPPRAAPALPTYLVAAAAMQSRAFPAFCHDPGAGPDLASRFSLANNPQAGEEWPLETLQYADPDLQAVTERVAFTFVDFALCDPRYAAHFAVIPRAEWEAGSIPAARWLANPPADASTAVPYVLAVDDAGMLCRVVVDDAMMRAALRCRESWRRLQELAGIQDSRIERALAKQRESWTREHANTTVDDAPGADAAHGTTASGPDSPAQPAGAQEPSEAERDPNQAYVETVRCSSCNECTLTFPKVFAYNDDKQAYIKDRAAATYRQLVEAAESCQVSVIHPGTPSDPDEPGLDELLERAKPFLRTD